MSAPLTKSQMAFELPKLSYIDTRWEEPEVQSVPQPAQEHRFAAVIAAGVDAVRSWRERSRALAELNNMSDRELFDVGLNRGDVYRIFRNGFNRDLIARDG